MEQDDTAGLSATALERSSVDFAILADRAEVLNNKLYIMGGAWDTTGVIDFSKPIGFSLAIGILVPWHEASDVHEVRMHIEGADATRITPELQATVGVWRPPTAIKGQSFRAMLAISGQVLLPGRGSYVAVVQLGNGSSKHVVFHAVPAQQLAAPPTSIQR